ncbi:MAG: acyltransferase [Burkholderiales bacterium]
MTEARNHLDVLDGWRGISILLVLAAHLLPLGPARFELNDMFASMGMVLFFILSGFLITQFLLTHLSVRDFLIRRFFRIVPLAWLALAITLPLVGAEQSYYAPNFLFYANLPPVSLLPATAHFWSLSVEVQFYIGIAIVVALLGRRGLMLLPAACLAITVYRVTQGAQIDIGTSKRVDEILAGGVLALVHAGKFGRASNWLARPNVFVMLLLLAISSHMQGGFMNYFRPYFAAALVGCTLGNAPGRVTDLLRSRVLRYIATISFALYVFHGILAHTWLGSGDKLVKYLKRPLLFAATFAMAHLSTFYFEKHWIALGKKWATRYERTAPV